MTVQKENLLYWALTKVTLDHSHIDIMIAKKIKRSKYVTVKRIKDLTDDDDVFISQNGANVKVDENLCICFGFYYGYAFLTFKSLLDVGNVLVVHGEKRSSFIKDKIIKLKKSIKQSHTLKSRYQDLKSMDVKKVINVYMQESHWLDSYIPYILRLLESKDIEQDSIIRRLLRKIIR